VWLTQQIEVNCSPKVFSLAHEMLPFKLWFRPSVQHVSQYCVCLPNCTRRAQLGRQTQYCETVKHYRYMTESDLTFYYYFWSCAGIIIGTCALEPARYWISIIIIVVAILCWKRLAYAFRFVNLGTLVCLMLMLKVITVFPLYALQRQMQSAVFFIYSLEVMSPYRWFSSFWCFW
jgi:hypothetical protein